MEQSHIDRCNRFIPAIVKAFPEWDLLVPLAEDDLSFESVSSVKNCDGLVQWVVTELVEGSEEASEEGLRDKMISLLNSMISDLERVEDALDPKIFPNGAVVRVSEGEESFEGVVEKTISIEEAPRSRGILGYIVVGKKGSQFYRREDVALIHEEGAPIKEVGYWVDVRTNHLVTQEPLSKEQVDGIIRAGYGKEKDYEERLPGKFWHSSFPPFPED